MGVFIHVHMLDCVTRMDAVHTCAHKQQLVRAENLNPNIHLANNNKSNFASAVQRSS